MFPTHIVAVGGLVTNDKDQVLLVKSPRRGWEFPGGQVERGESLPQALVREIEEESGITAEIKGIVGIYSNISKKIGYDGVSEIPTIVNIDFVCRYVSGEPRTSSESIAVKWVDRDRARELVRFPKYIERFKNMLEFNGAFHVDTFKDPFEFTEQIIFPR